ERPGHYALVAPPQLLRGRREAGRFRADLRLEYGACAKPAPEFLKLGTFHSHGDLGPAHSAIDEHDELFEAGLHLTAGHVDGARPEFAAAFVVGRTRFTVPVERILPHFRGARPALPAWLAQVKIACDRWCEGRALSAWDGARDGRR